MNDFVAKQNALFACLDDASKELKGTALEQTGPDSHTLNALQSSSSSEELTLFYRTGGDGCDPPDRSLAKMRGKQSIFKKPELPIGKCLRPRRMPDYQINPHKWKKYSLEDADISDYTNTSAALAFLQQIDIQNEQRNDKLPRTTSGGAISASDIGKIEFKKLSNIRRKLKSVNEGEVADAETDRPKLKGSKLVMPEYVIGRSGKQKQKTLRQKPNANAKRAAGTLKLPHLQEEDEDELGEG